MIRQKLLGTPFGRLALGGRETLERVFARQEQIGTIVSDQLAGFLLVRLCRPAMTFIDVGAHIGSVIAEVRRIDPSVRIEAVEAMADKAAKLRAKFPGVVIHETAVGDRTGEVSFFVNVEQSGYSSLSDHGGGRKITVPLSRLDDLVSAGDVDMVKIDVEGAELGVLRGAEALVARCRPTIMFESGPHEVLGYTKRDMHAWFAAQDYGLFVPNRLAHDAPPLSLDCFVDAHHYPRRTTNYFAVARERIEELRLRARSFLRSKS